jgi:hypothetical protein
LNYKFNGMAVEGIIKPPNAFKGHKKGEEPWPLAKVLEMVEKGTRSSSQATGQEFKSMWRV